MVDHNQKAHTPTLPKDVCMQYEKNPPMGYDIFSGNKNEDGRTATHTGRCHKPHIQFRWAGMKIT